MRCPVPGCDNDDFGEGQPFCPRCGLIGLYRGKVSSVVSYWEGLVDDPGRFCRHFANQGLSTALSSWFSNMAELEENHITGADIYEQTGINPETYGIDPTQRVRATDTLEGLYSSVRGFRISHPEVPFFRCWFCDIKGTHDALLMPPMNYAHSTMDDDYLRGFRPDYTLNAKLKTQRDQLKTRNISKPEPSYGNVNRLSNSMSGFRGIGNEYLSQMADWTRAAHQADDAENSRREQAYYRALEDQRREIAELEKRMSDHPARPDARSHKPCPNCGMMFPFVLRPLTDTRYMMRTESNFNEPLTWIEMALWGSDENMQEADRMMNTNAKQYFSVQLANYAIKSGAAISPFYMLLCDLTYGPIDWE